MTFNQSESADLLTGVAETLTVTLYARALETQQKNSFFQDYQAVEITEKMRYDFEKYRQNRISLFGIVVRTQEIDRLARDFLAAHSNAIVINLGCGLCTRFTRIDSDCACWYEIDFPEVIDFRRKFFEESDHYRFISGSILDFDWLDGIQRSPAQPILILMEGVSMYLTEEENRTLIEQISQRLAPASLIVDVVNRKTVEKIERRDAVSKINAEFKFGIDKSEELKTWGRGITIANEVYYLEQFMRYPQRLPLSLRCFSFLLPLFKNYVRVVSLDFATSREISAYANNSDQKSQILADIVPFPVGVASL